MATGHVVAQLAAPQAISELVKVGLVREQTGWMLDLLGDPAVTGAVIVASPEEMPVNETIELAGRIDAETNVDLAAVVVNRVLPELFGRGEEEVFERLRKPEPARRPRAGASARRSSPSSTPPSWPCTLRRTRAEHLTRLREGLDRDGRAALRARAVHPHHGMRATRQVAEALGAELGY